MGLSTGRTPRPRSSKPAGAAIAKNSPVVITAAPTSKPRRERLPLPPQPLQVVIACLTLHRPSKLRIRPLSAPCRAQTGTEPPDRGSADPALQTLGRRKPPPKRGFLESG